RAQLGLDGDGSDLARLEPLFDLPLTLGTHPRRPQLAVRQGHPPGRTRPPARPRRPSHRRVDHEHNGVPIQDISDTVGHRSTHVTETVYRHVIVPAIRGGATVMDDVFGDFETNAGESGARSTESVARP